MRVILPAGHASAKQYLDFSSSPSIFALMFPFIFVFRGLIQSHFHALDKCMFEAFSVYREPVDIYLNPAVTLRLLFLLYEGTQTHLQASLHRQHFQKERRCCN